MFLFFSFSLSPSLPLSLPFLRSLSHSSVSPPITNSPSPWCIVLCGPSGAGKSSFISRLLADFPLRFGLSVSHTTRQKRPNEVDGVHYHFVDEADMWRMIGNGDFLEWTRFANAMYGTQWSAIDAVLAKGLTCVLDINMDGVKAVRRSHLHSHTQYFLITPPSLHELESRLRLRGTSDEKEIEWRLQEAKKDLEEEGREVWDGVVVNYYDREEKDRGYRHLKKLLHLE